MKAVFKNGYLMERLYEYEPIWGTLPAMYIEDAVELLEDHVWSRNAYQRIDWDAHREYIFGRAVKHLTPDDLRRLELAWQHLRVGSRHLHASLTHGDPTFDNMMLRRKHFSSHAVIIDPLPPYQNGEMPQVSAVDVGKIMQSLIGYEEVKYGVSPWTSPGTVEARFAQLKRQLNPTSHEWRAAHWFLIAHIVRLIPYQPIEKREQCRGLLRKAFQLAGDLN